METIIENRMIQKWSLYRIPQQINSNCVKRSMLPSMINWVKKKLIHNDAYRTFINEISRVLFFISYYLQTN